MLGQQPVPAQRADVCRLSLRSRWLPFARLLSARWARDRATCSKNGLALFPSTCASPSLADGDLSTAGEHLIERKARSAGGAAWHTRR